MEGMSATTYASQPTLWSEKPSNICLEILKLMPPKQHLRVLDIGCGSGRNALFLARNGYAVTAIDMVEENVARTARAAENAGLELKAFQADLREFRLAESYDILFSTGVLQNIPPDLRPALFEHYKQCTNPDGLNVFSVYVAKPFILKAPNEETGHLWLSGELLTYYADWLIEHSNEEIYDCASKGVAHQHAVNRIIAKKVACY